MEETLPKSEKIKKPVLCTLYTIWKILDYNLFTRAANINPRQDCSHGQ